MNLLWDRNYTFVMCKSTFLHIQFLLVFFFLEADVFRHPAKRQPQGDVLDGLAPRSQGQVGPGIALRRTDGSLGRTKKRSRQVSFSILCRPYYPVKEKNNSTDNLSFIYQELLIEILVDLVVFFFYHDLTVILFSRLSFIIWPV